MYYICIYTHKTYQLHTETLTNQALHKITFTYVYLCDNYLKIMSAKYFSKLIIPLCHYFYLSIIYINSLFCLHFYHRKNILIEWLPASLYLSQSWCTSHIYSLFKWPGTSACAGLGKPDFMSPTLVPSDMGRC